MSTVMDRTQAMSRSCVLRTHVFSLSTRVYDTGPQSGKQRRTRAASATYAVMVQAHLDHITESAARGRKLTARIDFNGLVIRSR